MPTINGKNLKNKNLINQQKFCKECGKEVSNKNKTGLCPTCAAKTQRVCERPSREELKKLIRIYSFVELGKKYGVSDKTISKWCIAENLPSRKKDIRTYSKEEWEKI